MTHIREGAKVSYVGETLVAIGDQGQVIAASGLGSHVRWTTGARAGAIDLVGNDDLVETRRTGSVADVVDDSLMAGPLVHVAVRDTYDLEGPSGLLAALAEDGHLAALTEVAEEALEAVSARLRTDLSIGEVLASLDPEEQDSFVSFVATALMRDATSGGE